MSIQHISISDLMMIFRNLLRVMIIVLFFYGSLLIGLHDGDLVKINTVN